MKLIKKDGRARLCRYQTGHGSVETPVFMNVATQAAIKGALSAEDLERIGCQVALANTYHLHLRPGEDIIRSFGGLHGFMDWNGPVLTDSGGFQVFSLARLNKITEEGVSFSSHIDGRKVFIGPEESVRIQASLGSDILMAFDECIENPSPEDYVRKSIARTTRWLERCKAEWLRGGGVNPSQVLWGINQGGTYPHLRSEHMKAIAELDLPGYAVGGLAVGEETSVMYNILDTVCELMPEDKPRYLMGVGTPLNIIESVSRGIDFFDCVMPARNARHGHVFTWDGIRNLRNEKYKHDNLPIDPDCACPACRRWSRAYLRHLFAAGEMLAMRLCVIHNLYFYNELMLKIRESLAHNRFAAFKASVSEKLGARI